MSQPPQPPKPARAWLPLIIPAIIFVTVAVGLIVLINAIGLDTLRAAIESAGPLAPLLYIGIKALTYIFAPLTSGPIQFGAGLLFGLWPGTLYTLLGEVIGGSVNFWIARKLGRPVVARLAGESGLQRIDTLYDQVGGWQSLAYARLFLFSVWDFLSYAAGFTSVRYRSYLIVAVVVGFFPTLAAVALGTAWADVGSGVFVLYVIIAVLSALPIIFRKRIRRWLKLDEPKRNDPDG